ncbi:MAG: Lrp/AsnC ligand binding domain-containing protein [Pseudomonadota bacterium]
MDLDRIDRAILRELSLDGRLTVKELSERVNLSKTPCHTRMRRLIDEGYILGFRAVVDHARLGLHYTAFVQVTLGDTRTPALAAFNAAALKLPEIVQCHMIAGAFDYLLQVRTESVSAYRRLLGEEIATLPHVANTSTYISMEQVKEPNSSI